MQKTVLLALFTLLASSSAYADMAIAGVGGASCGKVLALVKDDSKIEDFATFWLQGFLSGMNFNRLNQRAMQTPCAGDGKCTTTNIENSDGMILWVLKYCEENPLDLFVEAASALDMELLNRADTSLP